jgi:hypothetical protein
MGGCDFICQSEGRDANDAFRNAVEEAEYKRGHDPYNGTISTISEGFVMIPDTWKDVKQRYVDSLNAMADLLKRIQEVPATEYVAFNSEVEKELDSLPAGPVYLRGKAAKTKSGTMNGIRAAMKGLRKKRDSCTAKMQPSDIASHLLYEMCDPRVDEKRGPCGCIDMDPKLTGKRKPKRFLFFGIAAS